MELFGGHQLLRRLDGGGPTASVEFFEASPVDSPGNRRLLVRIARGEVRWPPWATPAIAQFIIHPNVVQMFAELEVDSRQGAVLELVPGIDLRSVARPVEPGLACFLVREVLQGLAAGLTTPAPGGAIRVTVGCLAPRLIRLSTRGEVKVWGLGFPRLKPERQMTETLDDDRLLFLAPEQFSGTAGDDDPSTDVFAAGAILHLLIDGRPLIGARSPVEYVRAVLGFQGETFMKDDLPISDDLTAVVGRMLARDPTTRFRDAAAALSALATVPELSEGDDHFRQAVADLARRERS